MIKKLYMEHKVKQTFLDYGFNIEPNPARLTFSISIVGGIEEDGDILYYMIDGLNESTYSSQYDFSTKTIYTLTFTMSGKTPKDSRKNYLYINTTQDIKLDDNLTNLIKHFYDRKSLSSTIKTNIRENKLNKILEQ